MTLNNHYSLKSKSKETEKKLASNMKNSKELRDRRPGEGPLNLMRKRLLLNKRVKF